MGLTLYRRHTPGCTGHYKQYDRSGKSCRCMIHVEGKLGELFLRTSTHTRTWARAERIVKLAEASGIWTDTQDEDQRSTDPPSTGKLITEAVAEFYTECRDEKARDLAGPTYSKYVTLLERLRHSQRSTGSPASMKSTTSSN